MNRYLLPAVVALILTLALPTAAQADLPDVDPSITDGSAAREFRENRTKWLDSGITDYRFVITPSCFCISVDPVEVKVRPGKVKISDPEWFGPRTIPGVFKVIHGAIKQEAASIDTSYSRFKGYPRRLAIDFNRMMADEEIAYTVTDFRKLKPLN
ncbi:MAG: DUF6174 domain-containing protein [Solirubrobacterales bacterium]